MGIWKGPSLLCSGKDNEDLVPANDDGGNGEDGEDKHESLPKDNKLFTTMPRTNAIVAVTARGLEVCLLIAAIFILLRKEGVVYISICTTTLLN